MRPQSPKQQRSGRSGACRVSLLVGGAVGLVLLALVMLRWAPWQERNTQDVVLAVVGPLSGPDQANGEVMRNSVQLRVQQANQEADPRGLSFRILPVDDQNDPTQAKKVAEELVARSDITAVIGHNTSPTSLAAGPVYAQAGIPVLTANATSPAVTANNPWYFRTIWDNAQQAAVAAVYMDKMLGVQTVTVIHDNDAYGQSLADAFVAYWNTQLGLQVKNIFAFGKRPPAEKPVAAGAMPHQGRGENGDGNDADDYWSLSVNSQLDELISELRLHGDPGMIFLATHAPEAAQIIKKLHDFGKQYPIFGGDALATQLFQNWFNTDPMEQRFPGYYTDGIYAVSHFLYDLAGARASAFLTAYREAFRTEPDGVAAGWYDSANLLITAIRDLGPTSSLNLQRHRIRDYLAGITGPDKAVTGVTGPLYFDHHGSAIKPVPIGQYLRRNLIAALNQLQRMDDPNDSANLAAALADGTVFIAGTDPIYKTPIYYKKTSVVHTGIQLTGIRAFDPTTLTYELEGFVWFRSQGTMPVERIVFANAVTPVRLETAEEETTTPHLRYQRYHIRGTFRADFAAQTRGSNQHVLGLAFRHQDRSRDELVYIPDLIGMGFIPPVSLVGRLEREHVLQLDNAWRLDRVRIFPGIAEERSLGRPAYLSSPKQYAELHVELQVSRKPSILASLIPPELALYLVLCFAVAIVGLELRRNRHQEGLGAQSVLVVEALLVGLLLLVGETALLDQFGGRWDDLLVLKVRRLFATAWWVMGGLFVYLALDRLVLRPLEVRTDRTIPSLVRGFLFTTLLLVATGGALAFVFKQTLTGLLATSGVLAVVMGLAVQTNIASVFAGIAINFERPFRVGDWIQLSSLTHGLVVDEGRIVDITWRTTRILTRDNSILCVPNHVASDSIVYNYSYPDRVCRMKCTLHVDPGQAPARVKKLLLDGVSHAEGVLATPRPTTRVHEIAEGVATYEVVFFFHDFTVRDTVRDAVWNSIWNHLALAGIEPTISRWRLQTSHSYGWQESDDLKRRLLRHAPIFRPFPEEAIKSLCQQMRQHYFLPGQIIVERGERGDSLFVIAEGCVSIVVGPPNGADHEVARLGAGEVFGEMALLTGQPRTATVQAITTTTVYEITKPAIAPLFDEHPESIEQLGEIIALRQMQKEPYQNKAAFEEKKDTLSKSVARTIVRFFSKTASQQ